MLQQNILLTVDAVIFSGRGDDLQLLLVKRKNDPCKGMWALPGGFVEDDEELETAAIRQLEEETLLHMPALTQLYTFGTIGRDPRGRTVSVVYYGFTNAADHEVTGSDDAAEAEWIKVKDITDLAFDHKKILEFALKDPVIKSSVS